MVNYAGYSGAFFGPVRRGFQGAADAVGVQQHVAEIVAPLGLGRLAR